MSFKDSNRHQEIYETNYAPNIEKKNNDTTSLYTAQLKCKNIKNKKKGKQKLEKAFMPRGV